MATIRLLKDKLQKNIKIVNDCHEWQGTIANDGYGVLYDFRDKQNRRAHRLVYELFIGQITNNLFVCHSCNNKKCVNPNHLYLGDNKQNQIDAVRDGLFDKLQEKRNNRIIEMSDYEFNNWIKEKSKGKKGRAISNITYYTNLRKSL
jgi:hypothetical protein